MAKVSVFLGACIQKDPAFHPWLIARSCPINLPSLPLTIQSCLVSRSLGQIFFKPRNLS